jgi:hypothetical protein
MGQKKVQRAFDAYKIYHSLYNLMQEAQKHQEALYIKLNEEESKEWNKLFDLEYASPCDENDIEDEYAPDEACGISFSGCNEFRPCVLKKGHTEPHRNIDGDESEICGEPLPFGKSRKRYGCNLVKDHKGPHRLGKDKL